MKCVKWKLKGNLQRKSMIKRPSHNRPVGWWKKVRPVGGPKMIPNPIENPPVSEFESPKLNTTGFLPHLVLSEAPNERLTSNKIA